MNNNKKVILITGASSGIGENVARTLIKQGVHVIAVARRLDRLEQLDDYAQSFGNKITIAAFDITEFDKIDQLGHSIYKNFGYLDGFISCAENFTGCMPLTHYTPKIWNQIIETNLTANWRFIRSIDPLLRAATRGATVIFSTPKLAVQNTAYYAPYNVAKAGLKSMIATYRRELEKTDIDLNLIELDEAKTNLRNKAFPNQDGEELPNTQQIADIFIDKILM